MGKVIIYTDGASRGNPGPASIGIYAINEEEQVLLETGKTLGDQTNNFAEYSAVIEALMWAQHEGYEDVLLRSDSQLLIRQLGGEYKVKSEVIRPLYLRCTELIKNFKNVELEHVRREFNKEADALANKALDEDF